MIPDEWTLVCRTVSKEAGLARCAIRESAVTSILVISWDLRVYRIVPPLERQGTGERKLHADARGYLDSRCERPR